MKWFRLAAILFKAVTLIMAVAIAGILIAICTSTTNAKHMTSDPNYNGTLGLYIVMILIQFALISLGLYGLLLSYRNWKNNNQLDHIARHRFIMWLSFWTLASLTNTGIAVFAIVQGKKPEDEMAHLFDVFARNNHDVGFVDAFEKHQKDNSCCGIYGPDDWLMVQLRSGSGGGGGGGGYQSLDYGFRQNPSTGHCHLTPPTIPSGCGRKILEQIHFLIGLFAGILIFESILGFATSAMVGYCFYYWLEKDVIVIPEDEVSNLIVIEPESSTSLHKEDSSNIGHTHSSGPYLGPPPADYPPLDYHSGSARSRPPSYLNSPTSSSENFSRRDDEGARGPSVGPNGFGSLPPGGSPSRATANLEVHITTNHISSNNQLSAAGPTDEISRAKNVSGAPMNQSLNYGPSNPEGPTLQALRAEIDVASRRVTIPVSKPVRSTNHILHKQEASIKGKLLGEMHFNHNRDHELSNDSEDHHKGHKSRHPTVAILRNKNAQKPRQVFADQPAHAGNHGHSGHLAQDITQMTGNPGMVQNFLKDAIRTQELKKNPEASLTSESHPGARVSSRAQGYNNANFRPPVDYNYRAMGYPPPDSFQFRPYQNYQYSQPLPVFQSQRSPNMIGYSVAPFIPQQTVGFPSPASFIQRPDVFPGASLPQTGQYDEISRYGPSVSMQRGGPFRGPFDANSRSGYAQSAFEGPTGQYLEDLPLGVVHNNLPAQQGRSGVPNLVEPTTTENGQAGPYESDLRYDEDMADLVQHVLNFTVPSRGPNSVDNPKYYTQNTPRYTPGSGNHTVDHDVHSGHHQHKSQMSASRHTRRQHGNLKKLKGKEVSLTPVTPQGSGNGPGTRTGLNHQTQRSHHQSQDAVSKRSKSRSSNPEKTEVIFKNPRSLGER